MTEIPLTVYRLHIADRILFLSDLSLFFRQGCRQSRWLLTRQLGDDIRTHLVQHFARAEKASTETA